MDVRLSAPLHLNPFLSWNLGKQKFEVITLICPASDFVATLDTRFMLLGDFHLSRSPSVLETARITVMNTTYAHGGLRDLILDYVTWSLNALCPWFVQVSTCFCHFVLARLRPTKATTDTLTGIRTDVFFHLSMSLEDTL